MESFVDKIAVVTGGGTGMGRELVRQLAKDGCHVAMCDVIEENMHETYEIVTNESPNVKISMHVCDVSIEDQVNQFKDDVLVQHDTDKINLLFNNAGIGGGGSFVEGSREEWEKCFAVCWYGVYYCTRAFIDYIVSSEEGHIINTSSINGFWASLGGTPHTSYSAAKFAVKGFSEALIDDLRVNAPHVNVSVVMPGHIGTSIAENTGKILGGKRTEEDLEKIKENMIKMGLPVHNFSPEQIEQQIKDNAEAFKNNAPTTSAQAAEIILSAVKRKEWRILVGDDAKAIDEWVRGAPEDAYNISFNGERRENIDENV